MARIYKDYGLTFFYRTGDINQIKRLAKYCRVRQWTPGMQIKCKKAFFNYFTDIIDSVDAEEYIQVLHTDYKTQGFGFEPCEKINRYIGVSKKVCETFEEITGIKAELCYNPCEVDKPRKVLHLISATRLTPEKGKDRMIKLGQKLNQAGVPYLWLVFTDSTKEIDNPNIVYMKPRLDITDYIADSDWLVQLSNNGERFWLYTS